MTIIISFTDNQSIAANGYSMFPDEWSLIGYQVALQNSGIVNAYKINIIVCTVGTITSVLCMLLCAYPISRKDFEHRNKFTYFIYFSSFLSGGLVPWYIMCTQKPNEVMVEAIDESLEYQTRGKQDYGDVRGIWQDVYLEERPIIHLNKFRIITKIDGSISIKADVNGKFDKLAVRCDGNEYTSYADLIEFKIDNPILWDSENPYLYDCEISVTEKGKTDEIKTYFGIREVGIDEFDGKKYITLNKKPIYISSTLDQAYNAQGFFTLPDDEYAKNEILRSKALGHNAVRIHIKSEEKRKMCWADRLGLMIIEDIPCWWGNPYDIAKNKFEEQMYDLIDRDINHPSVIYWTIFNETWGLKTFWGDRENPETKWEYEKDTQEWVRKLYHAVKKYDPTRIVEDNSPCMKDHVETDVNSWHFYINGYENVKAECERVDALFVPCSEENYIGGNVMTDIPVMNSECGNYWGVDGNSGDSDISWHYKYMMNEFRLHEKICGFVFTELTDVINEFNGFYRINGSKKYCGYEEYNPQMTLKDLHCQTYLGADYPPMKTVVPKEVVKIPLFISSFDDTYHNKKMKVKWALDVESGIDEKKQISDGVFDINFNRYGTTKLESISIEMPDVNAVAILRIYLTDENDNIVMSNFLLFDVYEESKNIISLDKLETIGFKRVMMVQEGNKLNCIGTGSIKFSINTSDIGDISKGFKIIFEASSKEELTKDIKGNEYNSNKRDLDFMNGYKVDRGENRNSFYMTDDEVYPTDISVFVNGEFLYSKTLDDDPADSRGCLSWHYQNADNLLDEAGSYGYICDIDISKELIAENDIIEVEIKTENGLSLFGRKSGRYPIGIEVIS